jgi:hypothetical protein
MKVKDEDSKEMKIEQRMKKHPKLIILDTFVILQHRNGDKSMMKMLR